VSSFFDAGYAEMMRQMYPPFPTQGFTPNFTGYDLANIDWYKADEAMAQTTDDAIIKVIQFTEHFNFVELS